MRNLVGGVDEFREYNCFLLNIVVRWKFRWYKAENHTEELQTKNIPYIEYIIYYNNCIM